MKIIHLYNKYYETPAAWNELTQCQLITCLRIIESNWPEDRKRIALIKCLSGIGWLRFIFCNMREVSEFFYLADFLYEENTLTKNLVPVYQDRYGPGDFFQNLVVSEYVFTENHYHLYKEHAEEKDLNCLIGILYRRGKSRIAYNYSENKAGDLRRPFNDNMIEKYARDVKHWPAEIKRCILHWYEGCRQQLYNHYHDCFGGSGEPVKRGMLSLVVMMAETGTFGDFEKVEKLLLHNFFIGLSENIDQLNRANKKIV